MIYCMQSVHWFLSRPFSLALHFPCVCKCIFFYSKCTQTNSHFMLRTANLVLNYAIHTNHTLKHFLIRCIATKKQQQHRSIFTFLFFCCSFHFSLLPFFFFSFPVFSSSFASFNTPGKHIQLCKNSTITKFSVLFLILSLGSNWLRTRGECLRCLDFSAHKCTLRFLMTHKYCVAFQEYDSDYNSFG